MSGEKIVIAVFTGTGNTLVMAAALADELRALGRDVSLFPMERAAKFDLPKGAALGLAMPVACFSTYPTVWRFIDSLPEGGGREAFLLATMGGMGAGMEGPIRRVLEGRGYSPGGALLVRMPGNYGHEKLDAEENGLRAEHGRESVRAFARKLNDGGAVWPYGVPIVSNTMASLAHGQAPWRTFRRMFPLALDAESCTDCGLCATLCPEGNIAKDEGRYSLGGRCQSCQRCAAFCPSNAIRVPGKSYAQYRGAPLESILSLISGDGAV
ncbi:MAG: EFR1 family ferrodoxin [Synergistaceae bacterium]|jgi:Pyruvate/2-oxoacid:ferredoxin oxidoreductase delta subunit|nr:EFR1 family ferrodoxin [Synergistaceae bacterium]